MFYFQFQFEKAKSIDGLRSCLIDILRINIDFFFFIIINDEFIKLLLWMKIVQQSLVFYQRFIRRTVGIKMFLNQFQHSFSVDQEQKILREIQVINKKLNSNPFSVKHIVSEQQIKSQKQEQKYFSQQCEELFNDNNNSQNIKIQDSFDDSLFSNKNQLLLDNYEKQITNFKEFQTDKYSSQSKNSFLFNKNNKQQIPFQPKVKNNFLPIQQQNSLNSQKSKQKKLSKSKVNKEIQTKSKSRIKSIAQSKIKKYIENKQNILPASNLQQREKSFIKQVRKKIRFETQPDCYQFSSEQNSLENQKNDQVFQLSNNYSRSKGKLDGSRSTLQCTFKPNILKKSSQIAQNLQPSFERLTQDIFVGKSQSKLPYKAKDQLISKKYSAKRLDQLSQPRKQKILTENQEIKYDFRPSLSKKSLYQMANCTMNVAERNKLWLQQKEQKISKLKVQEQQKKVKQQIGSYAPKLTPYKGDKQVHLSRYAKQGMSNYFQRVSMAKQKNQTVQKKKVLPKQQVKESNFAIKKKTYDDAVKELHKKIMTMNL